MRHGLITYQVDFPWRVSSVVIRPAMLAVLAKVDPPPNTLPSHC